MTNKPIQRRTQEPLPLRQAPRCGARTRTPCRAPAVNGKKRCRMHGGANGSDAPRGERNGNYRDGLMSEMGHQRPMRLTLGMSASPYTAVMTAPSTLGRNV